MTATCRVEPMCAIIVVASVANLIAIETENNLDAIVFAFDVRSDAKEQVESMSIMFLEIDLKEDGEGEGGYAKDMSTEWFDVARKMLLRECTKTNTIITTALIAGKNISLLITK